MNAIRAFAVLFVAVILFDAVPAVPTVNLYKNKSSGRNPNRKIVLPNEWINISMKSDPVVTVPSGRVLELECEAVGTPPPSIKWHHGTNFVSESGFAEQNEVVNSAIGKVRSRLIVDCAMPHNQGVYTCTGTSGSKSKNSSPISVLVEESETTVQCKHNALKSPRIVAWGPTILETIDKDVTLPCVAIGNPQPSIYWLNNKNQIINNELSSSHYKLLENGDLLLTQISWDDMGTYTCIAQNSVGQDKVESFVYPVKKEEKEETA